MLLHFYQIRKLKVLAFSYLCEKIPYQMAWEGRVYFSSWSQRIWFMVFCSSPMALSITSWQWECVLITLPIIVDRRQVSHEMTKRSHGAAWGPPPLGVPTSSRTIVSTLETNYLNQEPVKNAADSKGDTTKFSRILGLKVAESIKNCISTFKASFVYTTMLYLCYLKEFVYIYFCIQSM